MRIGEDLYTVQHCAVRISSRAGDGGQGRGLGIISECQSYDWASQARCGALCGFGADSRSWYAVEHGTYRGAKEECSSRL